MFEFNTVEEAVEDLKAGKIILVTDDEDRENEGDFICAAEFATTENVNFMATYGKGLICMLPSRRTLEDRDTIFHLLQGRMEFLKETDTQKQQLI